MVSLSILSWFLAFLYSANSSLSFGHFKKFVQVNFLTELISDSRVFRSDVAFCSSPRVLDCSRLHIFAGDMRVGADVGNEKT